MLEPLNPQNVVHMRAPLLSLLICDIFHTWRFPTIFSQLVGLSTLKNHNLRGAPRLFLLVDVVVLVLVPYWKFQTRRSAWTARTRSNCTKQQITARVATKQQDARRLIEKKFTNLVTSNNLHQTNSIVAYKHGETPRRCFRAPCVLLEKLASLAEATVFGEGEEKPKEKEIPIEEGDMICLFEKQAGQQDGILLWIVRESRNGCQILISKSLKTWKSQLIEKYASRDI